MEIGVIISLGIYFIGMLAIGYWSYRKTSDLSDYMLAGRGIGPAVTALSAGASDMSGWMLMGLPGAMYVTGLSSIWIAVGLTVGAYLNYLLLAPRLRTFTEVANDSITIPDYLENRFFDRKNILRLVSGVVILVFFTLYASAGLVSGGRLFQSAFGTDYALGIIITVGVVVAYTLFGGFLAVSTTDFVQGCIMFVALILVPIVALTDVGGTQTMLETVKEVDPQLLNILKGVTTVSLLSSLAWGLGYFGQPHIIVRFMAITSNKEMKTARRIGMSWMIVGLFGALVTGLVGVAYYAQNNMTIADPETIFIEFANILFNPLITGFLLAAILAAIMSTISSQLLVTSSAVTEDFYKTFFRREASDKELVFIGRLAVLAVAVVAFLLSVNPSQTILALVSHAWAGFGSAFGPVILISLFWKRMTRQAALAGIITGGLVVIFWLQAPNFGFVPQGLVELTKSMYEMIPGFTLSTLAVIIVSMMTKEPTEEIQDQFENFKKTFKQSQ